jgi:hypothetical protein
MNCPRVLGSGQDGKPCVRTQLANRSSWRYLAAEGGGGAVVYLAGRRAAIALQACCAELGVLGALPGNCGTPSLLTTGSGNVRSPCVRKHAASSRSTTIGLWDPGEVAASCELPQLVRVSVSDCAKGDSSDCGERIRVSQSD